MSDTERLAALLHEQAIGCWYDSHHVRYCEPDYEHHAKHAARLIAQGVRVGDDGLTVLDAWRVLEREYPEATVARLHAALAAQPTPFHSHGPNEGLDRERLARVLEDWWASDGPMPGGRKWSSWLPEAAAIADAYEADE